MKSLALATTFLLAAAPAAAAQEVVLDAWEHVELSKSCSLLSTTDRKKGYLELRFDHRSRESLSFAHPDIPFVRQLGGIHVVATVAGRKIGESWPPGHKFANEAGRYAILRDGIGSYDLSAPGLTRGVLNALKDGLRITFSEGPKTKATYLIRFPDPKPLATMADCLKRNGYARTVPRS